MPLWVGSSPACLGFLLVDSTGAVRSANAEALRILGYPGVLQHQAELEQTLKETIGTLLVVTPNPQAGWSTQLVSGRRRYRCRGVPVTLKKERLTAVLIERPAPKPLALAGSCDEHHLSPRERETVTLLAKGFTNKEIAARMRVSVNTVKALIRFVMLKLGVTTRTGIIGRLFED